MKLLTKAIEAKLRKNAEKSAVSEEDHKPVVKFFSPSGAATWLFTELLEDGDTLFGLCDLGHGTPELGYASLGEIASIRVKPFGLGIERDLHFRAELPLSEYAKLARENGRIVNV